MLPRVGRESLLPKLAVCWWTNPAGPTSPALSPQDELKTISVPPGYHAELVASEPLIDSPIVIDFDADGHTRLRALYPDTSVDDILENTEFEPTLGAEIETIPAPEKKVVELIRRLDPLKVHEKELRAEDMRRGFEIVSG